MRNRKYLGYILRHKWYVFIAGRKIGLPLWQGIMHDLSKFRVTEWFAYRNAFFTIDGIAQHKKTVEFDFAWLKHQHRNKHHWQYWLLLSDHGVSKPLEMPRRYVLEMVADWLGAGRAITGKWEHEEWFAANKEYMNLHPQTRKLVEEILEMI